MRETVNKFVRSRTVLSALLLSTLFISAVTVLGILILDMAPPLRLTVFTCGQLILSCAVIWLMRKLEVFDISDFSFKGIGKGFLMAWFGFVYTAVSFFVVFFQIPENSYVMPNIFYLLIVVLHPFAGTGLFEEVLYRGLVLKILLRKTGYSKRGIIRACVISSVLFGFLHIVNILAGAPVSETLTQMISAAAAGFFYAVIFVRTGKLWIPVLFHGLLNVSVQIFNAIVLPDALLQNADVQAGISIAGFVINTLFAALPILAAGLVLLRKAGSDIVPDEKNDV